MPTAGSGGLGVGGSAAGESGSSGAGGAGGSSGTGGASSGAGGGSGSGGSGGSSQPAYCAKIPGELAIDCAQECGGPDSAVCDNPCQGQVIREYVVTNSAKEFDEFIVPPRILGAHADCVALCGTQQRGYSTTVRVRNQSSGQVDVKVSSPMQGGLPSGSCGFTYLSDPQCHAVHMPAASEFDLVFFTPSGATFPDSAWVRVEIHAATFAEWAVCAPETVLQ